MHPGLRRSYVDANPSNVSKVMCDARGTCESRCLESGVSTDPEPCGFARPRLAVRGFPVSGEKGILVVESNPGQASKRPCPEQVIAKAPETEHFVKFFVVHSEDNQRPAAKLSPFIVAKVLEHLIGHSYQAKKLHSGDLLVEVTTQEQSVAIQKMKSIVETSVTVTPHRTLNTVRGVISEEDLLDGRVTLPSPWSTDLTAVPRSFDERKIEAYRASTLASSRQVARSNNFVTKAYVEPASVQVLSAVRKVTPKEA
ncbi:hypothetical protein ISCGN_026671 [Ixodes scapularis]